MSRSSCLASGFVNGCPESAYAPAASPNETQDRVGCIAGTHSRSSVLASLYLACGLLLLQQHDRVIVFAFSRSRHLVAIMSCCCQQNEPEEESCCGSSEPSCCGSKRRVDWLLWGSVSVVVLVYIALWSGLDSALEWRPFSEFSHGVYQMMAAMWWGIIGGILTVGVMHQVPREAVMKVIGQPGSLNGVFRAIGAGVALDLCNHGILLVGMKLYERGASLGQVFAFLIASPWNSFSLTLILVTLIGFPLTILFILCSAMIALVSGILVDRLFVRTEAFCGESEQLSWAETWESTKTAFPGRSRLIPVVLGDGFKGSRMILRWFSLELFWRPRFECSSIQRLFRVVWAQSWGTFAHAHRSYRDRNVLRRIDAD